MTYEQLLQELQVKLHDVVPGGELEIKARLAYEVN